MNVLDHLKSYSVDDIKTIYKSNAIEAGAAMMHVSGDFNLSTLIRNSNFFGFKEACYVGMRQWDRRGAVGTHNYINLNHFRNEGDFIAYIRSNDYTLIGVENNIPAYSNKTHSVYDEGVFNVKKPMFIFGEERAGLSTHMLDNCDMIFTIPAFGSVRSLNVGTASGIIMSMYRMN